MALNDIQTFEVVCLALDDIADIMGSCKIYERIHWFSELQSAKVAILQLPKLYRCYLMFLADVIDYSNTHTLSVSPDPHRFRLNVVDGSPVWVRDLGPV